MLLDRLPPTLSIPELHEISLAGSDVTEDPDDGRVSELNQKVLLKSAMRELGNS